MKEKDTRKLSIQNKSYEFILNDSFNYEIRIDDNTFDDRKIESEILFIFSKSNVKSDILFRVVLEQPTDISVKIIIKTPEGIHGVESQLDMRALILHPDASIQFVPSLEIDEMDVSVDHKSTIGAPSREWIQYMGTRGLDLENSIEHLKNSFLEVD